MRKREKKVDSKIESIKKMDNNRVYQLLDSNGNPMVYGIYQSGYWWKKLHGLPTD